MESLGVIFDFEGSPVGMFESEEPPSSAGSFHYEPFRGPGHFQMHKQLQAAGSAQCSYTIGGKKVEFLVTGCPEHGVLSLTSFTAVPSNAL